MIQLKQTKPITYVALILDKSGSMGSIQKEAIGHFNEQVQTLQECASEQEVFVTGISFNHSVKEHFSKKAPGEIELLTEKTYRPTGSTALLDAMGHAMSVLEHQMEKHDKDENVAALVAIVSDGYENASREYSGETISSRVKELEKTGKWTFTYLGAEVDIHQISKMTGIAVQNMGVFDYSSAGMVQASHAHSHATQNYLRNRSLGVTQAQNFYDGTAVDTEDKK